MCGYAFEAIGFQKYLKMNIVLQDIARELQTQCFVLTFCNSTDLQKGKYFCLFIHTYNLSDLNSVFGIWLTLNENLLHD
jgi:hypothetical protein